MSCIFMSCIFIACIFMSCIFMPCYLVRHFHVLQFHVLHFQRRRHDIWHLCSFRCCVRSSGSLDRSSTKAALVWNKHSDQLWSCCSWSYMICAVRSTMYLLIVCHRSRTTQPSHPFVYMCNDMSTSAIFLNAAILFGSTSLMMMMMTYSIGFVVSFKPLIYLCQFNSTTANVKCTASAR